MFKFMLNLKPEQQAVIVNVTWRYPLLCFSLFQIKQNRICKGISTLNSLSSIDYQAYGCFQGFCRVLIYCFPATGIWKQSLTMVKRSMPLQKLISFLLIPIRALTLDKLLSHRFGVLMHEISFRCLRFQFLQKQDS